jgi:hypothetical protein
MPEHPRIIDVTRKPSKCPVCGERPVDIIYGTGDMTEAEFLLEYRKPGMMGGNNIPRKPPVWACPCGCRRFRKVNPDGTYAPVKVKLLKNIRRAPLSRILWETESATESPESLKEARWYRMAFDTEAGESGVIRVCALSEAEARSMAEDLVTSGRVGLKGTRARIVKIPEERDGRCERQEDTGQGQES